jgi:hypothetical protein
MNRPVIDLVDSDSDDDQKMPAQSRKRTSAMEDRAKASGQQAPPQQQAQMGEFGTTPNVQGGGQFSIGRNARKTPRTRGQTGEFGNTTPNVQAGGHFSIGGNARKTPRTRGGHIIKRRKKK